jgi:serine/threonine protein kinase
MEFCDGGSLRDLLRSAGGGGRRSIDSAGGFAGGGGGGIAGGGGGGDGGGAWGGGPLAALPNVIATALDVARGVRHLHRTKIVHGDLARGCRLLTH